MEDYDWYWIIWGLVSALNIAIFAGTCWALKHTIDVLNMYGCECPDDWDEGYGWDEERNEWWHDPDNEDLHEEPDLR